MAEYAAITTYIVIIPILFWVVKKQIKRIIDNSNVVIAGCSGDMRESNKPMINSVFK